MKRAHAAAKMPKHDGISDLKQQAGQLGTLGSAAFDGKTIGGVASSDEFSVSCLRSEALARLLKRMLAASFAGLVKKNPGFGLQFPGALGKADLANVAFVDVMFKAKTLSKCVP